MSCRISSYDPNVGAVDYGGCDYGKCDYGGFNSECEYGGCDYGECEYGGCVSVRVWPIG